MNKLIILSILLRLLFAVTPLASAQTTDARVRGVLFYSPSCGHCHYVITEILPPLFEKHGDQLFIVGVDVSQPSGQALFSTTLQFFNLESGGVPFLVIGDTYLVGSVDIPEKLPGMVEQYLAQGGVAWPPIPGMAEAMSVVEQEQDAASTEEPLSNAAATSAVQTTTDTPTAPVLEPTQAPSVTPGVLIPGYKTGGFGANFASDWLANSLATLVLVIMIVVAGKGAHYMRQPSVPKAKPVKKWVIPVISLIGLGVAGYLAYVETTLVEAFCGPVGDCNTVQQSEYARLFGIIPIGVLGLVGYIVILATWLAGQSRNHHLANYAALAQLGLTAFGLLFSIYLTFLEPFVIGATCAWCLTSAILITILFWLSLPAGRKAWSRLRRQ